MSNEYQNDSISWKLQLLQQRIEEWWELQTRNTISNVSLPDWLESPLLNNFLKVIAWSILILIVAWLLWQIGIILRPYLSLLLSQIQKTENREQQNKLKELPASGWLDKAQQFQQRGDYQEACICLYMAVLQNLHEQSIISHQSSRTDGEYLNLVRKTKSFPLYQKILITHQEICFGNRVVSEEVFRECRQAYGQIAAK